ncbi:high-affinity Zn(2+) transporter zrt1 [Tulasnella sp. 418]|nr:high-affinity Zn(2+) transporter zrt1 [Tulasnella sp. 418]
MTVNNTLASPGQSKTSSPGVLLAIIVVIFVISTAAAGFPTAAKRFRKLRIPSLVFFIGKHFGTGVILSTAFIHLLGDAHKSLSGKKFGGYENWPGLIVLLSLLSIFTVEYVSTVYVENIASNHQESDKSIAPTFEDIGHHHHHSEGHSHADGVTCGGEAPPDERTALLSPGSPVNGRDTYFDVYMHHHDHSHRGGHCVAMEVKNKMIQLLGICVLQLGIMIHSFVIGLTLSVTSASHLPTLLTAILFHQLFEGLSLGVRLSTLPSTIPDPSALSASENSRPPTRSLRFVPPLLAFLFGITTPAGIALGILLKHTHKSLSTANSSTFGGVMSAISAGLLIYAGTVELLGGDFVNDADMRRSSRGRQTMAFLSLGVGATGMALIG